MREIAHNKGKIMRENENRKNKENMVEAGNESKEFVVVLGVGNDGV